MAPVRAKAHKGNKGGGSGSLDNAALSQLTTKIDRNLEDANAKKLNGKRKRASAEEEDATAKPSKKQAAVSKPPQRSQGAATNGSDKKALLLEEIKALGGDEDDLDLVAGIDSDVEEGGSSSKKASASAAPDLSLDDIFKGELAKFAAGLGFDKVQVDEEEVEDEEEAGEQGEVEGEEEEEDDEEVGDEDEDEDEDDEDEDMEETQPEPIKEAPKPKAADPFLPKNPKFSKLMFEPRPDWHAADVATLPSPKSDEIGRLSTTITNLSNYAQTLMEADATQYRDIVSKSSSHRFMSTIMTSGTLSDKVSALTLEVQEAPIHNIKAFENLMGLAGKRSRGQAIAALGALVDLLGNGVVLPSDRRLRTFHAQPALLGALQAAGQNAFVWRPGQALPGSITKAHLIMWKYEDWLKDTCFKILQLLEVWSNDEIEYSRSRSLDFVFGLLKSKPEQEANLLRLLVNKLGDREKKIASRASYFLLQLLTLHPNMKTIVIQTIEQEVLLRPGQSMRAQYYAINTLNQTILSNKEPSIADTLVRIYFELFLTLLKSGALGAIDVLSTHASAKGNTDKTAKKLVRIRDGKRDGKRDDKKKFGSSNKAAPMGTEHDVSEKLVSALLTGVNRAIPFANADNQTLEEHVNTLFRITHSSNFNTSIQALSLLHHVAVSKQLAADRFYRTLYESLIDPRLMTTSKANMYLNLLSRSLKNDVDARRVKAFVKRMLQVSPLYHEQSLACGILFLVAELESLFPGIKTMINEPEMNDEDEEEVYHDVVEEGEAAAAQKQSEASKATTTTPAIKYDGLKRAPEYANAQLACLWELVQPLNEFHPTTNVYAENVLERQVTLAKPDMANHTVMHFLDKFAYRNPKTTDSKQRGVSIMQPTSGTATGGTASIVTSVDGKSRKVQQVPVNSAAFWNQKPENVAPEDRFLLTNFDQSGKRTQTSRVAKRAAAQEKAKTNALAADSDDEDEEDEEEIWQALKESRPEVDADNEDVDMDMDDDEDDLSGLESLLNMSDSDDDDEDDAAAGASEDDSDGGVEFANFSDDDDDDDDNDNDEEEGGADDKKKKLTPAEAAAEAFASAKKGSKLRRKQLKALPMFASVEDYEQMLAEEEEEDFR